MAGSKKWFKYTTDSGDVFGTLMDESNGEAVSNADFGPLDDGAIGYQLPKNVQPRRATYRSVDGLESASIIICDNTDTILTLPAQVTLSSGTLANLTQFVGEVIRPIPTSVDTGLTDGDVD
jgi:hypothetical protein